MRESCAFAGPGFSPPGQPCLSQFFSRTLSQTWLRPHFLCTSSALASSVLSESFSMALITLSSPVSPTGLSSLWAAGREHPCSPGAQDRALCMRACCAQARDYRTVSHCAQQTLTGDSVTSGVCVATCLHLSHISFSMVAGLCRDPGIAASLMAEGHVGSGEVGLLNPFWEEPATRVQERRALVRP